ncbi:hypothetical protein DSO57_1022845 [Entomophthora muscae]|uniref:Uncharacterized protein n=1 Tax=Entomophthora muscae TaxID=34485 RepID=A0ACC2S4W5_9FUNG|nr:hypothetical protein DSO57_1022845 [Entomophthora muscae]
MSRCSIIPRPPLFVFFFFFPVSAPPPPRSLRLFSPPNPLSFSFPSLLSFPPLSAPFPPPPSPLFPFSSPKWVPLLCSSSCLGLGFLSPSPAFPPPTNMGGVHPSGYCDTKA